MEDRNALLNELDAVSFCVNDLTLYLDTHPTDTQALDLFGQYLGKRKALMEEFESKFEPLTIDCVKAEGIHEAKTECFYDGQRHFTWVDGRTPWEGGLV